MNEKFIIKISCGWVDQKWVNKALKVTPEYPQNDPRVPSKLPQGPLKSPHSTPKVIPRVPPKLSQSTPKVIPRVPLKSPQGPSY